jgi:hypothetical protein
VATVVLVVIAHTTAHGSSLGRAAFIGWVVVATCAAVVVVNGARSAYFAISVRRSELVRALAGAALVTALMIAMAIAVTVYAIALAADTPQAAASANGPLAFPSTEAILFLQAVVLTAVAVLAATTTQRGIYAVRATPGLRPRA